MSFPALAIAAEALDAACVRSGRPPTDFDGLTTWVPDWPWLDEERGGRTVMAGDSRSGVVVWIPA